jgi:hypothetical protein
MDTLPENLRHFADQRCYVLVDGQVRKATDYDTWRRWMSDNLGKLAVDDTRLPSGKRVSTIFLGFDHSPFEGDPPRLFETMVFRALNARPAGESRTPESRVFEAAALRGSEWEEETRLGAATVQEAMANHQAMVEKYRRLGS